MYAVPQIWVDRTIAWAARTPEVLEVWFWGSRVSGVSRHGRPTQATSDLDIAIRWDGEDDEERIATDICLSPRLIRELAPLTGVDVDVQAIDPSHDVVSPEQVRATGVLVYSKKNPPAGPKAD